VSRWLHHAVKVFETVAYLKYNKLNFNKNYALGLR